MIHEGELSLGQRVRKTAARIGAGAILATAILGPVGCAELNTKVETTPISIPATPTTSEAGAGLGNPEPNITTSTTAFGAETAVKSGDGWILTNPDGQEVSINLPEGFTPDKGLVIQSDLQMNDINPDLSVYQNWDKVIHEVAGYNYDENDFSGNAGFLENVQGDMYAWRLFQGDRVEVPGIGLLEGSERRSVVLLVLNLQPDVIAWDNEGLGQVYNRHGFTATGRLWDVGTPEKIAEAEELLGGHWLFRQKEGTPEKSYIGVTDDPNNAEQTLYVSVAYRQWGNNSNGTPREQFQLLRAELVDFNK